MSDPVVLSYGDALLRASDLHILQSDTGWLNDRIIGYVFESAPQPHMHIQCTRSMFNSCMVLMNQNRITLYVKSYVVC